MKKQGNGRFKYFLGFLLVIFSAAVIILLQVALKLEIEKLTKDKILLEDTINAKNNETTILLVEIQKLESKERITSIAQEKLGMIQNNEMNSVIDVDKFQVDHVTKTVNSKYE
jgi:cell division protein FtsL